MHKKVNVIPIFQNYYGLHKASHINYLLRGLFNWWPRKSRQKNWKYKGHQRGRHTLTLGLDGHIENGLTGVVN